MQCIQIHAYAALLNPKVAEEPQYRVEVVRMCRHGPVHRDRERRTARRTMTGNRDSDFEIVVSRFWKTSMSSCQDFCQILELSKSAANLNE
jgi:hypothetical protein